MRQETNWNCLAGSVYHTEEQKLNPVLENEETFPNLFAHLSVQTDSHNLLHVFEVAMVLRVVSTSYPIAGLDIYKGLSWPPLIPPASLQGGHDPHLVD